MEFAEEHIVYENPFKSCDTVICTQSEIQGRKGTIYHVHRYNNPTPEDIRGHIVSADWLALCCLYGECFKVIKRLS